MTERQSAIRITLKTDKETTLYTDPSSKPLPIQVRGINREHGFVEITFTSQVIPDDDPTNSSYNIQVEPGHRFTGKIPPKTQVSIDVG